MPRFADGLDWDRVAGATPQDPLRVVFSACLLGQAVGWQGTPYAHDRAQRIAALPNVAALPLCPEAGVLGVPRPLTTLRGGDGFDVLDGRATVHDTDERDCTTALLQGVDETLQRARSHRVELAILLDVSDSCGTHVIYDERQGAYRRGPGVSAARMIRAGVPVVAQRDDATLGRLLHALDPSFEPDPTDVDFDQHPWFVENLA
jgi:uncharacterized protein YbbK (DUF523 family)